MNHSLTASFVRQFPAGPGIRIEDLHAGAGAGVTVLFGPSGAGKSTVLRCLAGLETPDEGVIQFEEETWFDSARRQWLAPEDRRAGYVPQDYALFPHLDVAGNIAYGLRGLPGAARRERVMELLRWLGIEEVRHRFPNELSGGQQQRVALARAVARRPRLLLLDEPLSAVDTPTRARLRGELHRWLIELGIPTLLVTHDRTEALTLGRAVVVLNAGRIEQTGPVEEVFNRPASVAVAGIVGTETVAPGRVLAHEGGLMTVKVGNTSLQALAADFPAGTVDVHVCIRPEEVILTMPSDVHTSARNRIPGTVRAVHLETPLARIELDCGFALKALVTRQSVDELGLRPGAPVLAWIKAPHVHLIPR